VVIEVLLEQPYVNLPLPERYLLALIDEIVQTTLGEDPLSAAGLSNVGKASVPAQEENFRARLWAIASPLPSTKWIPKLMS